MAKIVYWSGSMPKCDLGVTHRLNGVFYDALIPSYRKWGLVCPDCAKAHGVQLGMGQGQKYIQQPLSGKWMKVKG